MKQPPLTTQILRTLIVVALLSVTSLALAKPFPAGIIRLFSTGVAKPANSPSWFNANLDGMRLRPAWRDVQTGSATYDWSAIDTILGLGAQYGKTIGLSVGAGVNSPQWLYDAGAIKYSLQDRSDLSMPIPWDPTFKRTGSRSFAQWVPATMGTQPSGML